MQARMKTLLSRMPNLQVPRLAGVTPASIVNNFRYETINDGEQAILWKKVKL